MIPSIMLTRLCRPLALSLAWAQGVHEQIRCEPSASEWSEDGSDRESKVVFIGLRLDKDGIAEGLKQCLVE